VSEPFELWVAGLGAGYDEDFGLTAADLSEDARDYLAEVFRERGPLTASALEALATRDRLRIGTLRFNAAQRLTPAIRADAEAAGHPLQILVEQRDDSSLELSVVLADGTTSSLEDDDGLPPFGHDPAVLVWLANGVQEVTMLLAQGRDAVWPLCTSHELGAHAQVVSGAAAWWCVGADGHVLARVGALA
jgi:hypothetical protein